jgi:P27 family predicted phage terminase small subunit
MAGGRPKSPGAARRGTGRKPPKAAPPATVEKATPAAVVEACVWDPPGDLPDTAHGAWRTCVDEMAANRQLRASDLVLLKAYVEAVHVHAEASAKVHEFGVLVASPKGPVPNPMLRVQDNAARTIRLLSENLGLNPMSRIRAGLMEVMGASMVMDIRQGLAREVTGT